MIIQIPPFSLSLSLSQAFFDGIRTTLDKFFVKVIFPCILRGKTTEEESNVEEADTFCYCRKDEFGQMVACDNKACKIEWFHFWTY